MRIMPLLQAACLSLMLSACVAPLLMMSPTSQLMWALLKPLVGFDPNEANLFEQPLIKDRMTAMLGPNYDSTMQLLKTANELQQEGPLFYVVSRYAPVPDVAKQAGMVWNADTNQLSVMLQKGDGATQVFGENLTAATPTWPSAMQEWQAGNPTATALSANVHWVWRDLDSPILPTRGLSLALQTGAGQATQHGGPNGPFARLYGRLTGYLPLGDRWYGTARVEAGHIAHGNGVQVPDALGFRAGGDDSVRGYAYRSLAPTDAGGGTISGQRLLTASVEVARPIVPSIPSVWGALFIDAGRAVTDWRDYSPAWGYGAGIRWRSPVGPLRVDLAWADELKKLRLHFSVGIAF